VGHTDGSAALPLEHPALTTRAGGILSKVLQVRRLLDRGDSGLAGLVAAEVARLARDLEAYLTPEQIAAAESRLPRQRWHKKLVELSVLDGYAKWAPSYDGEANPLIHVEEPVTLALIGDVSGKDVLDAACGTGRYALRLAQAGARVCGVDGCEEMLALAKGKRDELGLAVDLRCSDLARLPFADASFDVVVCALALCHVAGIGPPIAEFARVLRPGGRLVISDFHPYGLVVGWRTRFDDETTSHFIENHTHMIADHYAALTAAGLALSDMREELVDERLTGVIGQEEVERFRGMPIALVIAAEKKGTT
jgi:ubiquinone/menaquinone biosynthesis C-methylase UbiE